MPNPLRRLLSPKSDLQFDRKNEGSFDTARRRLAKALERAAARSATAKGAPVGVQLLGQVTLAEEWPQVLAYWERRNPAGTAEWPRTVGPGVYVLNLWPLMPKRVRAEVGAGGRVGERQPKMLLCAPTVGIFGPRIGSRGPQTSLANGCTLWLENIGMKTFEALRLAPPILEIWATNGRLIAREIVHFDLDWTLPAAKGIALSEPKKAPAP